MNILIAEDDYVSRLLIRRTIQEDGHTVLEAGNGSDAWKIFQEQKPDMVISDLMMPGMNGIELCKKIRAVQKKSYSYIIILTAKDTPEDLLDVFEAGADELIIKPFKPDDLRYRLKVGKRFLKLEKEYLMIQEKLITKNRILDKTLADLKKTQAQILQAEKMASIGQLAAGVAHEINNPIGFIGSNLEALSDYLTEFDTLIETYQMLKKRIQETDSPLPESILASIKEIERIESDIDIDYLLNFRDSLMASKKQRQRIEIIVQNT